MMAIRWMRAGAAGGFCCLLVLALSVAAPVPAAAAEAEILDLDPNHQAMVARQKLKDRGQTRRSDARLGQGRNGGGDDSQCGSVDIGNKNNNNQSARNRVNPRDTTVIVTGPVINTARCR